MGRDFRVCYTNKIEYNYDENWNWNDHSTFGGDLPYVSRHNDVLGYIGSSFTKEEVKNYIVNLSKNINDHVDNMGEFGEAIAIFSHICENMEERVYIQYN